MRRWSFAKGHGTENDFVIVVDRAGTLGLGAFEVRYLCDRRAGIGADGLLRAVPARHVADWDGDQELWFMDYHNADGSVAEMCGNGIRVFARYLLDAGLASGPELKIATRDGVKHVEMLGHENIRVAMGPASVGEQPVTVRTSGTEEFVAIPVTVGNPHAVSFVDDVAGLDLPGLDLHGGLDWSPPSAFPDGVNCEFVRVLGAGHIAMRVYERGSGETRSCGTGTVAAATATWARDRAALPVSYRVDVPGGRVLVELTEDGTYLSGPAVIVAHGEVSLPNRPEEAN